VTDLKPAGLLKGTEEFRNDISEILVPVSEDIAGKERRVKVVPVELAQRDPGRPDDHLAVVGELGVPSGLQLTAGNRAMETKGNRMMPAPLSRQSWIRVEKLLDEKHVPHQAFQPGLFHHFAFQSFVERFTAFHPTAGKYPVALGKLRIIRREAFMFDEQDMPVPYAQGAYPEIYFWHGGK
jgi:hypothetical protein